MTSREPFYTPHPARPCPDRLRADRLHRSALPGLLALALALAAGACSRAAPDAGPGGMPPLEAARASLVVAQTRSQFPELSGTEIPYETRKPPAEARDTEPEPALRGTGTSVEPGLQRGARERIAVVLHLEKRAYARGFLEVTREGAEPERWRVVAYDHRGQPPERFDYAYVLATPEERVRYLVLLGGRYEADGEAFLGFEGTLIVPGPGGELEAWRRAYKLDFGFRFPVVPAHQRKVEQAVTLFREVERDIARLRRLRKGIAAAEGDVTTLRNTAPAPEDADRHEAALRDAEARLENLQLERDGLVETTGAKLVRYYELRRAIAGEYAAFTQGNRYLWADRAGKQAFYDDWKVVEFHHPQIDNLVSAFLGLANDASRVLDARTAAMDAITRHDNWARNPSKVAEERPSRR